MSKNFPEISSLLVHYNEAKTKMWKVYLNEDSNFSKYYKAYRNYENRFFNLVFFFLTAINNCDRTIKDYRYAVQYPEKFTKNYEDAINIYKKAMEDFELSDHEKHTYFDIAHRLCEESNEITSFICYYLKNSNFKPKYAYERRWYKELFAKCKKLSAEEPDMIVKKFFRDDQTEEEIKLKFPFWVDDGGALFLFGPNAKIKMPKMKYY